MESPYTDSATLWLERRNIFLQMQLCNLALAEFEPYHSAVGVTFHILGSIASGAAAWWSESRRAALEEPAQIQQA